MGKKTFQPQKNKIYSFNEIKSAYGKDYSFALRDKNNHVTAFILRKDMNPNIENYLTATELNVLVAEGPIRESNQTSLLNDTEYPVFIKEDTNKWLYVGNYWYADKIKDPIAKSELSIKAKLSLAKISHVIVLSKTSKAEAKANKRAA